jgi:8-oxo-dGTP diphosphatase
MNYTWVVKKTKQITVFSGCIVQDGKILMALRSEPECPEAHMKWEFPGGKADFGETPEECVAREILEETGVEVKVIKLLPQVWTSYWDYDWGTQQTFCFVYLCEFVCQKQVQKDHHVEKIEWKKIEDIQKLETLPGTKEVVAFI